MRWSVASLAIAFPVFLFVARHLGKDLARNPVKRLSAVRRWLTYVTLFVAATVLIGDLITLVHNLLSGELSVRFVLKVDPRRVAAGPRDAGGAAGTAVVDCRSGGRHALRLPSSRSPDLPPVRGVRHRHLRDPCDRRPVASGGVGPRKGSALFRSQGEAAAGRVTDGRYPVENLKEGSRTCLLKGDLVTPHPFCLAIDRDPVQRALLYQQWLSESISDDELQQIRSHIRQQRALGDTKFQAMVETALGRPARVRPRGRPQRLIAGAAED